MTEQPKTPPLDLSHLHPAVRQAALPRREPWAITTVPPTAAHLFWQADHTQLDLADDLLRAEALKRTTVASPSRSSVRSGISSDE